VQGEYGGYEPSKAKSQRKNLIAYKYLEGSVQSTPEGGLKERETARGEAVLGAQGGQGAPVRGRGVPPPWRRLGVARLWGLRPHSLCPRSLGG